MIHSPEHVRAISPYIPGKPAEEIQRELGISHSIKLASNESPFGPSPRVLRVLRQGIRTLNRYPDGSGYYLKNGLAQRLGLTPDEVLLGNGSNEIIELAVRTFLSPGDETVMADPSFVVYSLITQAAGGRSIAVPLKDWRHNLETMADHITDRTKIIFIANPNNPTGTINSAAEMNTFMKRVPDGVLVIVDEAYHEYVTSPEYADCMKYLREGRDILILRTFSKCYGLAGLRIGYGISAPATVTEMNRVRQPFNVNSLAQSAALAALEDGAHLGKVLKTNERGKKFLYKKLSALKINYIKTEANFIYLTFRDAIAAGICNDLLTEGIIVRPMGQRALRVTIGLPRENRRLMDALENILVKKLKIS